MALRVTAFEPATLDPLTFVMVGDDMRLKPEYVVAENLMGGDELGVFTIAETFEVRDGMDVVEATVMARERAAERFEDERNQAVLYYYEARSLSMVAPEGTLMATIPAPLSVEQVSYALKRLAAHPDYRQQRVLIPVEDDDGAVLVRLIDGSVSVEAMRGEGEG